MTAELPPGLALQKVDERIMTLNVGPQHPGFWTHENCCSN